MNHLGASLSRSGDGTYRKSRSKTFFASVPKWASTFTIRHRIPRISTGTDNDALTQEGGVDEHCKKTCFEPWLASFARSWPADLFALSSCLSCQHPSNLSREGFLAARSGYGFAAYKSA